MMTSSNGNIFRVTGPLCGEFTGHWWIHLKRPATLGFDVFFDLRLNKPLSKGNAGDFRRHRAHYDVNGMRLIRSLKAKNHPILKIIWKWCFLDKYMRVEHLFDIYAKIYMLTHRVEFYMSYFSYHWSLIRCYGVKCGIFSCSKHIHESLCLSVRLSQPLRVCSITDYHDMLSDD